MVRIVLMIVCLLVSGGLIAAGAQVQAQGKPFVDLELVLAVDVSLSMDHDEQLWVTKRRYITFSLQALLIMIH